MSQKFSTFVHMMNNKSNIEMQLATYKSMLTKASNDLAKSKQLVVTENVKHIGRLNGIVVENWMEK